MVAASLTGDVDWVFDGVEKNIADQRAGGCTDRNDC